MRLGIDAWGLSGTLVYTGVGQYTRNLLIHLAAITDDGSIVAYGAPNERRPDWLPASIVWRASAAPGPRKARALVSRALALGRQVRADGIDVFHAPGVHARASLPPVASVGCPLVVTVHDLIPLTHYRGAIPLRMKLFYGWNLRRALAAPAIVTVSESARVDIAAHRPAAGGKLFVIPNGVNFPPNHDTAPPARLGIREPYILYAGSYEPRKNLLRTLSAYARLREHRFEHQLVAIVEAASGHAHRAHEHIAALQLGAHVKLVHSLSEEDMRALYTRATAICFPSLAEGFGFPALQAAACATPVVASDIPAIRETLGPHAAYVDPESVESIAAGLRRMLTDEALRASVVAGASERVRAYSWERSARAHWRVFESVAQSQG